VDREIGNASKNRSQIAAYGTSPVLARLPPSVVYKIFSDFVTKQSFCFDIRYESAKLPRKDYPRIELRRHCSGMNTRATYSSGPTRSQTVNSFDCMAMRELNANVKRWYLTSVQDQALDAS